VSEPSKRFLIDLAHALRSAEHENVANAMCSGMLWAMYPEWFDRNFKGEKKNGHK